MSKRRVAVTGGHAYKKGGTFRNVRRKKRDPYGDPARLAQSVPAFPTTAADELADLRRQAEGAIEQRDAALRVLNSSANFALLVSNVDKAAGQLESLLMRFKQLINALSAFARTD